MTCDTLQRPILSPRVRRRIARVTGKPILLFPEGVLALNPSGNAIVDRLDGRTADEIVADLQTAFPGVDIRPDVVTYLKRLHDRALLTEAAAKGESAGLGIPVQPELSAGHPDVPAPTTAPSGIPNSTFRIPHSAHRPMGLLAELTYNCPLHCPYCSNPTRYPEGRAELTTDEWTSTIRQAVDMGVLHVLFSGGEPLGRKDLAELVDCAREAGAYTNLITSAVGMTEARARVHKLKRDAAAIVKAAGLPLTINVVLHRRNVDKIAEIIALADELGAERLELANTQFYGWAFRNRQALLPTREQLERAESISAEARRRLLGRMEVHYILPDYFGDRPKPCMNGWGQRYLTVNPVGDVLPCPTAESIPNLNPDNVRNRALAEIWSDSAAFNRFRGTEWMPEPCQSCDLRDIDFGGCRCQSALLTGDPAVADPACSLSPFRDRLTDIVDAAQTPDAVEYVYRANPA